MTTNAARPVPDGDDPTDRPTLARPREALAPVHYAETVSAFVYEVPDEHGGLGTVVSVRFDDLEPDPDPMLAERETAADPLRTLRMPAVSLEVAKANVERALRAAPRPARSAPARARAAPASFVGRIGGVMLVGVIALGVCHVASASLAEVDTTFVQSVLDRLARI